jgi:glycosyltransferase involved in cell wall biosynthesis
MPLVSVIIPCYNDGQYLNDAVASALKQTFKDIEIIIVNDGSTDNATLQKLDAFKDPLITVLHKENGHLSSARNHGIRHAKGTFIVTLDADDKFERSFIEKGINVLNQDIKLGAVTCYLKSFGLKKYRWKPLGGDIKNFLYRQESCASALFRKECWEKTGGYDEQMKSGYEDWEFWIRLTSMGWNVHVIKECLLNYRVTGKSMFLTEAEPKREAIVSYIMEKHKALYWQQLKEAVTERKIIDLRNPESTKVLLKNLYWNVTKKKK